MNTWVRDIIPMAGGAYQQLINDFYKENRLMEGTMKLRGELVDPERHELEHEVKAITYHGLKVEQQADQWLAEVIVDI